MNYLLTKMHKFAQTTHQFKVKPAVDAASTPEKVLTQIDARLVTLSTERRLFPETRELERRIAQTKPGASVDSKPTFTLSPSDFGPHNILVSQGHVRIIDLEFFGWDNPCKLIADTALHPLISWSVPNAKEFLGSSMELYGLNAPTLKAFLTVCSLKWSSIILGRAVRLFNEGKVDDGERHRELARAYMDGRAPSIPAFEEALNA